MIYAIIILSIILAAAGAFIFWLIKVLKNTVNIIGKIAEIISGKMPKSLATAYDDKYYQAHALIQIKYNAPYNGRIVDWSMYDNNKIVGFTMLTTESFEEFYTKEEIAKILRIPADEISEETMELIKDETLKPKLIKNVLIYAIGKDEWTWKHADQ